MKGTDGIFIFCVVGLIVSLIAFVIVYGQSQVRETKCEAISKEYNAYKYYSIQGFDLKERCVLTICKLKDNDNLACSEKTIYLEDIE